MKSKHNKSNTEMNRLINNEFNPKYKNAKLRRPP